MAKKRVLIFAGTVDQGRRHIRESDRPASDFAIVTDNSGVMGISPKAFDFVCVGNWYENAEIYAAYQYWQQKIRVYSMQGASK